MTRLRPTRPWHVDAARRSLPRRAHARVPTDLCGHGRPGYGRLHGAATACWPAASTSASCTVTSSSPRCPSQVRARCVASLPAAAVWLMSRLHPAFRRRTAAAQRALTRASMACGGGALVRRPNAPNGSLGSEAVADVEPDSLTDAALGGHLRVCEALVVERVHETLRVARRRLAAGRVAHRPMRRGRHRRAWTALATLGGASPLSAGTVEPAAWQLVTGYDLDSLAACELPRRPDSLEPPTGDAPAVPAGIESRDHDEFDRTGRRRARRRAAA